MNENEIPIDIQISKLQDWLISRRHVSKEWQKAILPIREKISAAIQDMPEHEGIVKLLSGAHINYFGCLKTVEILKETEADTKNMFGSYGSQRMKDWQEIIRLYEKDNVYLIEAAQLLSRNINYEIPGLKKQLVKLDQVLSECDKKREDCIKNEATVKAEYASICKEIGIKGVKIKTELCERLKELPEIYNAIVKKVPALSPSVDHYRSFSEGVERVDGQPSLPLLSYVLLKGNTTTYEWVYGEPPLTIQPDDIHIQVDDEITAADSDANIDFGDDAIDFNTEATIDFGDIEAVGDGGSIDWGEMGSTEVVVEVMQDSSVMDLEGAVTEGITLEAAGLSGGTATGADALSVLDNPSTREKFITDLMELEAFLKMRIYMEGAAANKRGGEEVLLSLDSVSDAKLSSDELTEMLGRVRTVLTAIASPAVAHLHNVKHSPRYVDSLSAQLRQKLTVCEKMERIIASSEQKKEEIKQQSVSLIPLLPLITQQTALLQQQIERDISKKYKNRPVNLIGGVRG